VRHVIVFCAAVLIGLAAVGSASARSDVSNRGKSVAVPAKVAETACVAGSVQRLGTPRRSYAAIARTRLTAFRRPGRGRFAEFGVRNVNGVATVFAVRSRRIDGTCRARWYRVQLPIKPNGVRGWVRAKDVTLVRVRTRVVVDLSARRVTLFSRGRRVMSVRAAIGSSATPTPTGSYYVNQRLIAPDARGPFGPGAVGISAFSEVLTGWVQGGPVAIHGTNRPDLVGQAVSNGCIRIRNDDLRRLFSLALAGTPVLVRA